MNRGAIQTNHKHDFKIKTHPQYKGADAFLEYVGVMP